MPRKSEFFNNFKAKKNCWSILDLCHYNRYLSLMCVNRWNPRHWLCEGPKVHIISIRHPQISQAKSHAHFKTENEHPGKSYVVPTASPHVEVSTPLISAEFHIKGKSFNKSAHFQEFRNVENPILQLTCGVSVSLLTPFSSWGCPFVTHSNVLHL